MYVQYSQGFPGVGRTWMRRWSSSTPPSWPMMQTGIRWSRSTPRGCISFSP
jgi:hypothetical protein